MLAGQLLSNVQSSGEGKERLSPTSVVSDGAQRSGLRFVTPDSDAGGLVDVIGVSTRATTFNHLFAHNSVHAPLWQMAEEEIEVTNSLGSKHYSLVAVPQRWSKFSQAEAVRFKRPSPFQLY